MEHPHRSFWRRSGVAPLLIALSAAYGSAQAGMFDEDARRMVDELRTQHEARFDQQGESQLDLSTEITRQAEEIARLRGQLETLTYELEAAKKRQQDFYLDLDSRLRKLETPPQPAVTVDPQNPPDSTAAGSADNGPASVQAEAPSPAGDPAAEGLAYEAALNQFKAGKYKEAASAFAGFVQQYPASTLAPNAQFWLGNAWYAQGNCDKAIEAQAVVTTHYPKSNKAPDAWLAVATCQQQQGKAVPARRSLEMLIATYPATPAAETAQQRLKKK